MHNLRIVAVMALIAVAGLLSATMAAAQYMPDGDVYTTNAQAPLENLPVPPEFRLPGIAEDDVLIVANDPERFADLERDGYRVYSDIAHAVSLAGPGTTIYITAGTYREYMFLFELSDLAIIGEEGVLVIADNDQDVCFMRGCSNIRIHNIDMVHEIGESPCLHNCVVVWDCTDVLIEYCDLSGCGYFGVEVLGNGDPRGIRVENCAIHDCQEAFYDVPGDSISQSGNVLWDNGTAEEWDPTGWNEGEMFGSERQPHEYVDYWDWPLPDDVPQPPAVELPPVETANLRVVVSDEMTEDMLSMEGYDTYFSIQEAFASAASGDTVFVTRGVYFENVSLSGLNDVTVIGEEQVLIVGGFSSDVFTISDCHGIRVSNIDVVHETGEDCAENCYVISGSTDVLIEYCDISGCGYVGVWAYGFDTACDVRVERCYIHDCEYAHASHGEAILSLFGTVARENTYVEMY